jgi:selenocysteine-specific elongation factor
VSFPPLTLGTGGHIDHGKTVLVEALTGVNTDRLPAERERGISIELGFAQLELPSGRHLSVVDVPGHERFVRTMVAGATGIDMFLLVVAADDGVMPQTREHLAVLLTLGVPVGVVALTKADLGGPEELELARADVADLLAGTPYEQCEVVAVSARRGDGLTALEEAIDRAAASLEDVPHPLDGLARLHVDRSFSLKGIGTVVTGTLWSGELAAGEEVHVEPQGLRARIRSIEVHDRALQRAVAGQRVALNLAGIAREEVQRGDVVTTAPGLEPTYLVDVRVELLPGATALKSGTRVHLHHGTRETPARVTALERETIEPASPAFAQLRMERAIVPLAGDRFVLRRIAPQDTIGGGVVVDARPRKHGPGRAHLVRLRALASDDPLERLAAAVEQAPSGLGSDEADPDLLEQLCEAGRARRVGNASARYFAASHLEEARARMVAALEEDARSRPLSREALADAAAVDEAAARALIEALVSEGLVRPLGPGYVAAKSSFTANDPAATGLLGLLAADRLEPRAPEALAAALDASAETITETLERLALAGRIVRVRQGVYYEPAALEEATRKVIELCEREGAVSIASLRDELSTSRKYAQALLEYLDAVKVTRRLGDEHVLRKPRP